MFFSPQGILMEVVLIVVVVFGASIILSMINQRQKRVSENTKLLEQALKNPALDRATLETLTYQLTGKQPLRNAPRGNGFLALILGLGWIALFTGIGLLIGANVSSYDRDMDMAGWIVGLIGFGLVSYPFALRELEARRAPQ